MVLGHCQELGSPPSPCQLPPHHPIGPSSPVRAVLPDGPGSSHLEAAVVWGYWMDASGGWPVPGPLQELQPPLSRSIRGKDS